MSETTLGHEEFLQRYVLNRALAINHTMNAGAVDRAEEAWNKIQEYIKNEVKK